MGDGFTVRAGELAAGGKSMSGLQDQSAKTASGVVSALSGMGQAASGHAGLMAALVGAAETGTKTFLDIEAAYEHTSTGLAASAESYSRAEAQNTDKARSAGGGAR